jgi:PII-like signaling protein
VNDDCLKLTLYFNEADRHGGKLVCDLLLALFERHALEVSILVRGSEGFGLRHELHTQRFLSLSDRGLPLVVVAVDAREAIEAIVPEALELASGGIVTLERARLLRGEVGEVTLPEELHEATKLTVYCGRADRIDGVRAHVAVVEQLREHGVVGATVLLGLDGTFHGARERARFFSRNEQVPMMVIAVGPGAAIAAALPGLSRALPRPIMTLERIRVCKRGGALLAEPRHLPEVDDAGRPLLHKLMVHCGEQDRHDGHPLHLRLIDELRRAQVAGATVMRGVWGSTGDGPPHGDRWLSLRRDVPLLTVAFERPARIRELFSIVDAVTDEAGVVTSEVVPAFEIAPETRSLGLASRT